MKKKSAPKNSVKDFAPLPVPEPLLRHHSEVLRTLMKQWNEANKIPPVLLVTGPSGIGKTTICVWLAQWLLCERRTHEPCGDCAACQRALHQNWIDFTWIQPESTDEGKTGTLKIHQFEELKTSQGFGAHSGGYRVILIQNAETLTAQAANSLLKLLEEPPQNWIFLLTAADSTLLLPTLVSRCQRLRLKPIPDSVLKELLDLSEVPRDRVAACVQAAQGSWGRAVRLAQNETWEKQAVVESFIRQPEVHLEPLLNWGSASDANLGFLIDLLELKIAETLQKTSDAPHDRREFWIQRGLETAEARTKISLPLNRKVLVQGILMPWLSLR